VSYLVLARKYRPQSFDDLIGQEHVTKTLANAIAQDRVAHAFLFTGVRGVGKTTSARILAKCLNCLGGSQDAKGPTATPCQTCAACTEIAAGVDMDVQEIDAASYNGVDEVRRLQEGLAFRPARDRFKIYTVDEVHMLSNAAWNAFLKTLEEPPPHVKFIFATTEVHKVPVTILSRCQRYDFKLVSAKQIAGRLKDVLSRESLSADDRAVAVLAREAAGSMRDAMSLLDQVIAYGSAQISAEDVTRVLGVADREVLSKLTAAVLKGDAAAALDVLDAVSKQGFDLVHLCRDFLHHIRNVVVAKVCTPSKARELLDLAEEEVEDAIALAQTSDADDLTRLFSGLSKAYDDIVKSGHVRAALEMTLVRLARRPPLLPLDELLLRLGELEKRLSTGTPRPPGGGGTPPGGPAGGGKPRDTASTTIGRSNDGRSATAELSPVAFAPAAAFAGPRLVPSAAPAPALAHAIARPAVSHERTHGALALAPLPVPLLAPPPLAPVAAPREETLIALDPEAKIETWRAILARVRVTRPAVAATLELAAPDVVTPTKIVLRFDAGSFEDGRAEESDAREVLAVEATAYFGGCAPQVTFEIAAFGARSASLASLDAQKRKAAILQARAAVENHPLVRTALAVLDAELKDIRIPTQED
jgi:DNA polymerase-3 subunit gamma/tau